jgi:hypothetical protein
VPDEIPDELLEEQDWLKKHREKSVTELEILHRVLENREMQEYFFFFISVARKSPDRWRRKLPGKKITGWSRKNPAPN